VTAPAKPRPGVKALKADLARMDRARDAALCANFLQGGINRWRHPDIPYPPISDGLVMALKDELRRMIQESEL
jgi:hypothetical protein